MRSRRPTQTNPKQYASDGNKKRLRRQNASEAQQWAKKNATSGRAIAPPRRVSLAINKNGFKRKDVQLSTDDDRIIALSQLRGQDKKSTKSCSQFVHNCTIRQNGQRKVRKCGKVNKNEKLLYKFVRTWYHILCFRPVLSCRSSGHVPTVPISPAAAQPEGK